MVVVVVAVVVVVVVVIVIVIVVGWDICFMERRMNGCLAPPNLYFRKHQEGLSVRNRSCPTQIHPNLSLTSWKHLKTRKDSNYLVLADLAAFVGSRSYHTATAVVGSMGGKVRECALRCGFFLETSALVGPRLQDKRVRCQSSSIGLCNKVKGRMNQLEHPGQTNTVGGHRME